AVEPRHYPTFAAYVAWQAGVARAGACCGRVLPHQYGIVAVWASPDAATPQHGAVGPGGVAGVPDPRGVAQAPRDGRVGQPHVLPVLLRSGLRHRSTL